MLTFSRTLFMADTEMIAYVPVIWNHDPKGSEISEFYYLSSYNINTTMRG